MGSGNRSGVNRGEGLITFVQVEVFCYPYSRNTGDRNSSAVITTLYTLYDRLYFNIAKCKLTDKIIVNVLKAQSCKLL